MPNPSIPEGRGEGAVETWTIYRCPECGEEALRPFDCLRHKNDDEPHTGPYRTPAEPTEVVPASDHHPEGEAEGARCGGSGVIRSKLQPAQIGTKEFPYPSRRCPGCPDCQEARCRQAVEQALREIEAEWDNYQLTRELIVERIRAALQPDTSQPQLDTGEEGS